MLDKWNVFDKLEYIGILIYNTETKQFSFDLKNCSKTAIESYKFLNADKDAEWFKETLFDRIFPPERVDARELLNGIGLKEYDAWEILKFVNLCSCNDLIWMSKGTNPEEFYTTHILGPECRRVEREERNKKKGKKNEE